MRKLLPVLLFGAFILAQGSLAQEPAEQEKRFTLQPMGYFQMEYEYGFYGEDDEGAKLDESNIYFNRVRFGVKGKIARDFSYMGMAELSPALDGPYLLLATLSYNRYLPYLKVTAGQFMSPFGLELNTPCNGLHAIDRSLFVRNLSGHFRDIGLMVSGGTGDWSFLGSRTENFFGYKVALLNGTGMNAPDDNRKKDIVARITCHPWEFVTFGASYRRGKHPGYIVDGREDERMGISFDVELEHKGLLLQSQYIFASDRGSYTTGGGCCSGPVEVHHGSVDRDGFMVQAMYMTPWKLQPIIRFDRYDPDVDIEAGEDLTLFIQNTTTYGLNYFANDHIRFQANYLYRAEETGATEHDNDVFLFQFQVNF